MSPLLKIRAERDQMSAIERRIADFILENSQLLRDYSSQQLGIVEHEVGDAALDRRHLVTLGTDLDQ